jgi:anthranilate synthase/aminodeoxychorismate synthase-like glutamine amidotransferase
MPTRNASVGEGVNILLVDHEDSFVHTLANYFRQTGATVSTVRTPVPEEVFDRLKPDLVVLSPGPGTPKDFDCKATIRKARARDLPIFGVCLGLQALAEAYGGELRQLHVPMHGKPSRIRVSKPGVVFSGLPKEVTVGRYHSIFADPVRLPRDFTSRRRPRTAHHGLRAPQGADRGGAVPSRIDHDARPERRHADDRECRGAPAAQGQGEGGVTCRFGRHQRYDTQAKVARLAVWSIVIAFGVLGLKFMPGG